MTVLTDPLHGTYEPIKPGDAVPGEYVRIYGLHTQAAGTRFVQIKAATRGKRGVTFTFIDGRRRVVPFGHVIYRLIDGPAKGVQG